MKWPALPHPSKLSVRERLLAALVIFAISALLLDRFVLGPWWRHVREVEFRVDRLEGTLQTYRQMLQRRTQIMAEVEAYSGTLGRLSSTDPVEVAALLREIERLGKESGIALNEVKPLPPEEDEQGQVFPFEIHTTGSFKQWVHLVYLLQTSESLFRVERATLGAKEQDSDILEGSLRISRKLMRAGAPP